jgi:uncharacterized protein YktB (UPF0637 family)
MYFRGAGSNQAVVDQQLEDNITKSLINLFEHSNKNLLKDFLSSIKINESTEDVLFDIQTIIPGGRADALIRTNDCDIYIESKYGASFCHDQLQNYLDYTQRYILYISKEKYSEERTKKYPENRVIFINWVDIAIFLINEENNKTYRTNTTTYFLIRQFIEYMEQLSMVPFNGWKNRDFEAFLSTDNEQVKIAEDERKRVKEKFTLFLNDTKEKLEKESTFYKGCKSKIGNLDKEHVWGAIYFSEESLINQVHVSIIMHANDLSVGIQIEGKKPTTKAIRNIRNAKEKFLKHLNKLDKFIFIIRDRYNVRASLFKSHIVAQIVIDSKTGMDDVEYIIKKMDQYKLVELRIVRIYDKQEVIIKEQSFIEECINTIEILDEMIQFLR